MHLHLEGQHMDDDGLDHHAHGRNHVAGAMAREDHVDAAMHMGFNEFNQNKAPQSARKPRKKRLNPNYVRRKRAHQRVIMRHRDQTTVCDCPLRYVHPDYSKSYHAYGAFYKEFEPIKSAANSHAATCAMSQQVD
mmetsp:Transcript_45999/g.90666  ORF Transcript_45999/g.90666 Transcript_45999/m.90666 type:complete len:135 (+) Transcript_45999:1212-1616(+)